MTTRKTQIGEQCGADLGGGRTCSVQAGHDGGHIWINPVVDFGANYLSEVHPNPGNDSETCSICGALLVCLSCGNHRTESEQQVIASLKAAKDEAVADAEQTLADWKQERERLIMTLTLYQGVRDGHGKYSADAALPTLKNFS